MMIPDRTNIGTAKRGKESSPPNMARTIYFAPTVNDGSASEGSTDVIPRAIPTGMAMMSSRTKMMKRIPIDIYTSPPR